MAVVAVVEFRSVKIADTFGNSAADIGALRRTVANFGGKTDRLGYLTESLGEHSACGEFHVGIIRMVSGGERFYVAVTAEQNNALVGHTHAMDDGRACGLRGEYVDAYIQEEIQVHGIKSLIKRDWLQMYECFDDFRAADAHIGCFFNQVVLVGREVDSAVFEIFLTARICMLYVEGYKKELEIEFIGLSTFLLTVNYFTDDSFQQLVSFLHGGTFVQI